VAQTPLSEKETGCVVRHSSQKAGEFIKTGKPGIVELSRMGEKRYNPGEENGGVKEPAVKNLSKGYMITLIYLFLHSI
jgi:hypothetical protein